MAALKGKVKDLKNISNETDIGGAPYWGDDILRVQINSKADFINTMETYRSRKGPISYFRGPSPAEELHERGLILSGLTYDNTDPANPIINPGYFLSEGEVIYYGGGTWATGGSPVLMVYLRKGAKLAESRVFEDGFNKEFLVEYEAEVFTSDLGSTGPVSEPLPSADLTKEYIMLPVGGGSYYGYDNWAERNFTLDAALDVIDTKERQEYSAFTDATLTAPTVVNSDYLGRIASRVDERGATIIAGGVTRTFAAETTSIELFVISPNNLTGFTGELPIRAEVYDVTAGTWYYDYIVTVETSGAVNIRPRTGESAFPTGDLNIFFNAELYAGTTALTSSYDYTPNFLDVTP